MNKQGRNRIAQSFEKLGFPIFLLDSEGHCLFPEGERVTAALPSACAVFGNFQFDGYLMRRLPVQPALFLAVHSDLAGAEHLLALAEQTVILILKDDSDDFVQHAFYRQLLTQGLSVDEVETAIVTGKIARDLARSVIVFQAAHGLRESLFRLLSETVPLQSGDELVEVDARHTAMIKNVSGIEEAQELSEYILAVDETLQQESGLRVNIGIGSQCSSLSALHDSYCEARKALKIGLLFHPGENVFLYDSMIMERFLSDISPEESMRFQSFLFNERTQRIFNEEMLQTIDMFFEKDLNLSDTARQLYIHRNTLVYRLEKIQRATGLDLRSFRDAVTFKLLYELRRCTPNPETKR